MLAAGFVGLETALPAAAAGIKNLSNGKVQLTIAKIPALKKVGGVVAVNVKGSPVAVVCTAVGKYAAFDLRCPHLGATVSATGSTWTCPAHGSTFDPKTGAKTGGVTPTGLTKVKTALKSGVLTVG